MEFLKDFFQREIVKKITAVLIIILFLYVMRGMINLFLLTFLFTYLIYSTQNFIFNKFGRAMHLKRVGITIILYALLFLSIAFFIYKYIPVIVNQTVNVINQIAEFDINQLDPKIAKYVTPIIQQFDFKGQLKQSSNYLFQVATNVGKWSINIFISLMLSMFFMLEKDEIKGFMAKFKDSKIAGLYTYMQYFGRNFLNSFGKVMQAQILIASSNTVLSAIALKIMGFPQLLGLGLMIFVLSLVPVAGVIVSLIPLCIIAYNIGKVKKVIYVLVMVAVLHGLESYVLNPKFMSVKTKLPVFFTFVVLIVSEHLMGIWGLLIGIPLFMFILDLINVKVIDK